MPDRLSVENPHPRDNDISFDEGPHIYTIKGRSDYCSVTQLCHAQFSPFDPGATIKRMMSSRRWPQSKYYGMTAGQIADQWEENRVDASQRGTAMHKMIEDFYQDKGFAPDAPASPEREMFQAFVEDNIHLEPYRAEWMIWDEELKLAGSIDMVFRDPDGKYHIYDWKRSKEIRRCGFGGAFSPVECLSHLPDSNFWHYSLQLNTYKALLERNYGVDISTMALVQIHPERGRYDVYAVPDLQAEVRDMFAERLHKRTQAYE